MPRTEGSVRRLPSLSAAPAPRAASGAWSCRQRRVLSGGTPSPSTSASGSAATSTAPSVSAAARPVVLRRRRADADGHGRVRRQADGGAALRHALDEPGRQDRRPGHRPAGEERRPAGRRLPGPGLGADRKVFDSSFDRGVPASFPIGVGQVIPGWDKALVGVNAGSRRRARRPARRRVRLCRSDLTPASRAPTRWCSWSTYSRAMTPRPAPTARRPRTSLTGLPTVTGAVDSKPTIKVPSGATRRPRPRRRPLQGDRRAGQGQQRSPSPSTSRSAGTTRPWPTPGPTKLPQRPERRASPASSSPFDQLVGVPVGSRVLLLIPAQTGQDAKTKSIAAVIDIVGAETSVGAK